VLHRIPYRELAQLVIRAYAPADRWSQEAAEHGVDPNTLQGQYGSPGSESAGDESWQRALSELHKVDQQRRTRRARMN
jgi:hypothetical protein